MSGQATIYKHKKSWTQVKGFIAQSDDREKKEQEKRRKRGQEGEEFEPTHTHKERKRERLSVWL